MSQYLHSLVVCYCCFLFGLQDVFAAETLQHGTGFPNAGSLNTAPRLTQQESAFLSKHWTGDGIPLQGEAPSDYSVSERSLHPEDCGTCHVQQYQDWQTSIHSKAMGPGILGQLVEMVDSDPGTAKICWLCHTPLAEQQDVLQQFDQNNKTSWRKNTAFSPALQHQGLVCAACHVRKHQRFGPPRRGTPGISGRIKDKGLPHAGFTASTAFGKSAFCKGCHQFTPDDYALNGKLIENTYNEWKASEYARKGIQCQDCHMPDRKHLWRGIHDPEMVKQGITITVDTPQHVLKTGQVLEATIKVANTGTGHYFPTYLTPKVFIRGQLVDASGEAIPDTLLEAVIGRETTMDISREIYDTRIAPGDAVSVVYKQRLSATPQHFPQQMKVEVIVYPDHFYARFYQSILENNSAGKGKALIEQAYQEASNSSFKIFETLIPLNIIADTTKNMGLLPSQVVTANSDTQTISQTSSQPKTNNTIDWNDKGIPWLDYRQGLTLAKQTGKPILLLFYAEWCATCHAYKAIFYNDEVAKATNDFIMIRVNADLYPELNQQYALDGDYVPRTFALTSEGKLLTQLYKQQGIYRYFMRADEPARFTRLMQNTLSLN